MDITVTPAGGTPTEPAGSPVEIPAALGSPLLNLRAVREAKLRELHLDLVVPRWEQTGQLDQMVVRYRPLNNSAALRAVEKREASKAEDWIALANADQLVSACVGVYVIVDGKKFTLNGDGNWVEFDPDNAPESEWVGFSGQRAPELAAALGVNLDTETSKSVALVRAVYFTDGDMNAAAATLAMWSAQAAAEADKEALGE